MYKCRISKAVWKDTGKTELYKVLIKDVMLPFPPYIGLSISDGSFSSGEFTSVIWDIDKKAFSARTEDELPWEDDDFNIHTPEDITEFLLEYSGWELPAIENKPNS